MDLLPPGAGPLLTPAEVGAVFRVSPGTVIRWANTGKLTAIRTPGGHRRYRAAEIRELLAGVPPRHGEPGGETQQDSTVTTAAPRPDGTGLPAGRRAPAG